MEVVPIQPAPYPYPHPINTQWPAATNFLPSSTIGESPSSSTSYWRQSPSTANSAYGSESNISGTHTPAAMSASSTMSYGPADSHAWTGQQSFQPPPRSMSYGNVDGMQHQYAAPGMSMPNHEYPRKISPYPFPTTIDTNSASIQATTMGSGTSAPLSAPVVPSHQFYPPTWNTFEGAHNSNMSIPAVPGRSMSMQWYAEPGHLDRVQEEVVPPVAYNHQGMQQFYSES